MQLDEFELDLVARRALRGRTCRRGAGRVGAGVVADGPALVVRAGAERGHRRGGRETDPRRRRMTMGR